MEQALQTYIAESRGLLQEMEDALLGLEYDAGDAELIGALFRAAHTIKGSAGMFGLDAVVAFTHVVENLLDGLREGRVVKEEFSYGLPKGMQGLVFNTRRPIFADVRVREALLHLFDFEWINRTYFFSLYKRTASYFDGCDLSAHGVPANARERELLAPFRGSVRDNISVAKPDATFEEIVEAAAASGADEFIERMPQGYDTMLEENAANLSGGQKQRLSIARALLAKPRILILDEAASALDPESEAIFIRNLSRIAIGRTVVMISHRLSTLVNADAILVMQQGSLMDSGRHEELLERSSTYKHLWNQQTSHL